jgi:PAS domain S-box-containing protein
MFKFPVYPIFLSSERAVLLLWLFTVLGALGGWIGWMLHWRVPILAHTVPMPPSGSLAFLLLSLSLLPLFQPLSARVARLLTWGGLALLGLLLAHVFLQFATTIDLGLEAWLAAHPITLEYGRMSSVSAFLFLLFGIALLVLHLRPANTNPEEVAAALAAIIWLFSATMLVWYLYGSPLFWNTELISPAFLTSLLFFFASFALLGYLQPRVDFLIFLMGESVHAMLLRSLIFPSVFIVLAIFWFDRVFLPANLQLNTGAWVSLTAIVIGLALTALLWRIADGLAARIQKAAHALEVSEQNLRVSESQFRGVVEQSRDGMLLTDPQGGVTVWNESLEKMTGISASHALGRFVWDLELQLLSDEQRASLTPEMMRSMLIKELQQGDSPRLNTPRELFIHPPGGLPRVTETLFFPITSEQGPMLCGMFRDITARKQAQQALDESRVMNAALADVSRALLFTASLSDISNLVLDWARDLTDSKHCFVGYIDEQTGHLIAPTMTRDVWWDSCQIEGKSNVFQSFGGLWGWVLKNRDSVLSNDPPADPRSSGTPHGHIPVERFVGVPAIWGDDLLGIISVANAQRDYTEKDVAVLERIAGLYAIAVQRVRYEASLKTAIEQKEALLREVHHRVKNNLQIITSLLDLRSDQIHDQRALQVFQECRDSIRSIALVHSNLYQTSDISAVNAQQYMGTLTGQLLSAYSAQSRAIQFVSDVQPLPLELDVAIPCGLIVTEMLTNSLKYAFSAETESPQISLRLYQHNGQAHLEFGDNGVGFTDENLPGKSLGLQLISLFVKQLRGELQSSHENGLTYHITFPLPEKEREQTP